MDEKKYAAINKRYNDMVKVPWTGRKKFLMSYFKPTSTVNIFYYEYPMVVTKSGSMSVKTEHINEDQNYLSAADIRALVEFCKTDRGFRLAGKFEKGKIIENVLRPALLARSGPEPGRTGAEVPFAAYDISREFDHIEVKCSFEDGWPAGYFSYREANEIRSNSNMADWSKKAYSILWIIGKNFGKEGAISIEDIQVFKYDIADLIKF